MRGQHYCFLLGAGASADAKVPTSKQLLERFILNCPINTRSRLKELVSDLGGIENANAETLALELLKRNEYDLYSKLRRFTIQAVMGHEDSKYLAPLFSLDYDGSFNVLLGDKPKWKCIKNKDAIPSTSTSRIFSLNYDLCMEDARNLDRSYLGLFKWDFKRKSYIYDDNVIYDNKQGFFVSQSRTESEGKFSQIHGNGITKLHGSVNWVWIGKGDNKKLFITQKSTDHKNVELIFGEPEKLRMTPPYSQVFFAFSQSLSTCSTLISIGYSWSDTHINRLISHEIKRHMKLVNVSLYSSDNRYPQNFFTPEVIHVKGSCSSVLRKRPVKYAFGEGSWREVDNGLAGVLQKVLNKQIWKTEKEWERIRAKQSR